MKRGNITKRGPNAWQLKFDVPSVDGKRQQRYATVRGTYKDAQKALTQLLNARDEGTLPDPTKATIANYVEIWFRSAHEQSNKTIERYRELANNQIIPKLGAHRLQQLKPEHIQTWHGDLLDDGYRPAQLDMLTGC